MMARLAGLVLVVVVLQVTVSGRVVQAATDPQILIAVDATPPACAYLISPGNHTRSGDNAAPGTVSTTRIPCPAGTIIGTATIPLSQAKANGEAYVPVLSTQASSSQLMQWEEQVHQLMQAKRRSIQANQTVRPLTTCGYTVYLYSGYNNIFNDWVQGRITYYISSNCSNVFLDTVYVDAGYVPYNNPVYWVQFTYSSYRDTCQGAYALLYPNTTYSFTPNTWQPSGQDADYLFQATTSPGCRSGGGGLLQNLYLGPLDCAC